MKTEQDVEKLAIAFYNVHKTDLQNDCIDQADVVQEAILHFLESKEIKNLTKRRKFIIMKLYEMLDVSKHHGQIFK